MLELRQAGPGVRDVQDADHPEEGLLRRAADAGAPAVADAAIGVANLATRSKASAVERLAEPHRRCRTAAEQPQEPCLLYTSPSPRDRQKSRMPSSA